MPDAMPLQTNQNEPLHVAVPSRKTAGLLNFPQSRMNAAR